jgi:hypothetical protein
LEVEMLKFKVGVLLGFALGWAVGSGRASEFWDRIQHNVMPGNKAESGPVASDTFERQLDHVVSTNDRTVATA